MAAQCHKYLIASPTPQVEQNKGIGVYLLGEQVVYCRRMFARVPVIRARALEKDVLKAARKQRQAHALENRLDIGGHFTGEQLGRVNGLSGQGGERVLPFLGREWVQLGLGAVRIMPRA